MNKGKKQNAEEEMEQVKKLGLSNSEIEKVKQKFYKYEKQGSLSNTDAKSIIQEIFTNVEQPLILEMEKEAKKLCQQQKTNRLELLHIAQLYQKCKQIIDHAEDESLNAEYIDAFVALGGCHDRSGCVQKGEIIRVLSDEFELTIDIQDFINKLDADQDAELSFNEFVQLFESGFDDTKSRHSMASIFTKNSQKLFGDKSHSYQKPGYLEQRDKEFDKILLRDGKVWSKNEEFEVKDRDFEKWYQKNG